MSAGACFLQTCREEREKRSPEVAVRFAEFSEKCSERRKTMSARERSKCDEMAKADEVLYDWKMKDCGPAKGDNKKDPNVPKRLTSGFFPFCSEFRPKIKSTNPGTSIGYMAKKLGEMWNNLSDAEKQPYNIRRQSCRRNMRRMSPTLKSQGKFDGAKGLTNVAQKKVQEEDEEEEEEEYVEEREREGEKFF